MQQAFDTIAIYGLIWKLHCAMRRSMPQAFYVSAIYGMELESHFAVWRDMHGLFAGWIRIGNRTLSEL